MITASRSLKSTRQQEETVKESDRMEYKAVHNRVAFFDAALDFLSVDRVVERVVCAQFNPLSKPPTTVHVFETEVGIVAHISVEATGGEGETNELAFQHKMTNS